MLISSRRTDPQHHFTQSIEHPNVCSIFGDRLIWITVEPMFARLRRCDHRMSTGVRVFAGVLIR
jgi:hypothetical protein